VAKANMASQTCQQHHVRSLGGEIRLHSRQYVLSMEMLYLVTVSGTGRGAKTGIAEDKDEDEDKDA